MTTTNTSLEERISTARKSNYNFERLLLASEKAIKQFVDDVIASNDRPTLFPKEPVSPRDVYFKVYLPAIPITPNETALLLEYLNATYMDDEEDCRTIWGDYFSISKCWFKDAYKLTTHKKKYLYF